MDIRELKSYSVINYLSDQSGYQCGYCGSPNSNFSNGAWAYQMTCRDYEDLLCKGWRRSGQYVYRPTMDKMCCPSYTIRCAALEHKLTKSQKKTLKRVLRFLKTGQGRDSKTPPPCESGETLEDPAASRRMETDESAVPSEGLSKDLLGQEKSADNVAEQSSGSQPSDRQKTRKVPKPGEGIDPSKPPCKKSKQLRNERQEAKLAQRPMTTEGSAISDTTPGAKDSPKTRDSSKTLHDYISEIETPGPDWKHKLECKFLSSSPRSVEFERTFEESYSLYKKYQVTIHKDPPSKCTAKQFARFLVESPLTEQISEDGPPWGTGAFHMQYRLDGKLIAVGVLDLLPKGLSSVYFYYDPEYYFLRLGTLSGLREISMVHEFNKTCKAIEYYYMGFYIHNCVKMKYKGQFQPLDVLCPEALTWQPFASAVKKFEKSAYSRLDETDKVDPPPNCATVQMLFANRIMPFSEFQIVSSNAARYYAKNIKEYAQLVGQEMADRMVLIV